MSGFYVMRRGWQDHPIFKTDVYSRRDAWVWLIEHVMFSDAEKWVNGVCVIQRRAQLSISFRQLATVWKWDEARVRRFFSALKKARMIECVVVAGQNLITLCNYDKHQLSRCVDDATTDAAATQQRRDGDAATDAHNKERKKVKKETDSSADTAAKKGTRWPSGQPVPEEWIFKMGEAITARGLPPIDVRIEAIKFTNYWTGKTGRGATNLDWDRTFINWCLNACGRAPQRRL